MKKIGEENMISKIRNINFNNINNPSKKIESNQLSFGKVPQADLFLKTVQQYTLDSAISELYRRMSSSDVKKAEVPFTKKGLSFVELDNMKLRMEKAVVKGKSKVLTFFSHETQADDGKVTCTMKMTNENLEEAFTKLKSRDFIEELENMTTKLNEEMDYMDI